MRAVAVTGVQACALRVARQEHRGAPDVLDHFAARARAEELHQSLEAALLDQGPQRELQRARADDLAPERDAPIAQDGAGVDEVRKALLLDQATDGRDPRRPLGR